MLKHCSNKNKIKILSNKKTSTLPYKNRVRCFHFDLTCGANVNAYEFYLINSFSIKRNIKSLPHLIEHLECKILALLALHSETHWD